MKKPSNNIVKFITMVVLCTIIVNQIVWIRNMYIVYQQEMSWEVNEALEKAIFMEFNERSEKLGEFVFFSLQSTPVDTVLMGQRQIVSADSTYMLRHDKNDPLSISRILQFLLREENPLDINKLDEILREELSTKKYQPKDVYVEQIDLNTDTIIACNTHKKNLSSYIQSKRIVLDSEESMALQAYVQTPTGKVLENMLLQLILSIILIINGFIFILILARTIFTHRKEEKMRQDSINAMTHEFKRPISSAVMQIALIPYCLEKSEPNLVKQYAENTLLELNKLTAYTERIQQISNNEKGKIILNCTHIEIAPFFDALVKKYSHKKGKEIHLTLEIDSNQQTLYADLLHFSNVMDNLLENAIKYSNTIVYIGVSVKNDERYFQISVKDDGYGISQNDKRHIFDRFYRSRNRNAQEKTGLGLGLTYVKAIVEEHSGKIDVISELGEGSEFIIHLPVK